MGEQNIQVVGRHSRVAVNTFAGRIHVEWDPDAAVTTMGQLPFFIEFLKVSGLYDAFVAECPLRYTSPNAPKVRDVLGTLLLSILSGHKRYAHITTIRSDRVNPELWGMKDIASEDSIRRALASLDEVEAIAWADKHLANSTRPVLSLAFWILDSGYRQHGQMPVRKTGRCCQELHPQKTRTPVPLLPQLFHGKQNTCHLPCRQSM